jgi:hypothetical protein
MFGDSLADNPEQMNVLRGVTPSSRSSTGKNPAVHGYLWFLSVNTAARRSNRDPLSLTNHLVEGVSLTQRAEASVDLLEGSVIDSPAVIPRFAGPESCSTVRVSGVHKLELPSYDLLVLFGRHGASGDSLRIRGLQPWPAAEPLLQKMERPTHPRPREQQHHPKEQSVLDF